MLFGPARLWEVMLFVITTSTASMASPGEDGYPNPQKDLYRCGRRGQPSWLCDPDQVLSFHEAKEVSEALVSLREETPCACANITRCKNRHGYSVSVAVMSFIPTTRTQTITAQSYATYLRENEWTFGNCHDDVVVVVAKREKQVAISAGDVAARKLSAQIMADIYVDTDVFFQSENFSEGILDMVGRLRAAFEGTYALSPPFPVWTVVQMAMAALFVLICFFSMYICRQLYS